MFRFKQFTIRQERAAMKVCTDACVLGAWADVGMGGRLLDIGTGTGLLALMAAQRNPTARIDAVEIDADAAAQAADNVAASPFADRVRVHHQAIQAFTAAPYDRILTNPPFYTDHLRSPDVAVNRALHTDELPFSDLLSGVSRLLAPDGQWWVLLPPYEMGRLTGQAAAHGLYPIQTLTLRHRAQKPVFRHLTGFAAAPAEASTTELLIHEADGRTYTDAFRALLRDFYLIF